MNDPVIHTIDLNFRGKSGTIGCYVVPHLNGCIMIETGPGSTIDSQVAGLNSFGYAVQDVTDIFLTHIHLDHAGAAGWWAKHGVQIHVHEIGAPHLINPEKLLTSARRLYGDRMDELWGEILPVSEDRISVMQERETFQINHLSVKALEVPGHASHHLAYIIGDACFIGDIGGIRLGSRRFINLPMPPPEFHLEKWRSSIRKIQQAAPKRIVPTHFGIYPDAEWHLQAVLDALDEVEAWMESNLPLNPSPDDLRKDFIEFDGMRAINNGIGKATADAQQIANPAFMSADGILRYWNKYRNPA
jgi:glyoxylase-like metal-dependent hydrolase (beta-lactamase superfamily II)